MPHASVRAAWCAVLFIVVAGIQPARAAAQATDSAASPPLTPTIASAPLQGHPLRWWEGLIAAGAVAGISAADEPLRNSVQRHRSDAADDAANVFRHVGQPDVYGAVSLGMLGVGLLSHNGGLERAGGRVLASIGLAYIAAGGSKVVTGRARPYQSPTSAFRFHPFGGDQSLPSAHTTAAFAMATSLADDIHSVPAQIALYGIATGTAWSRINDDDHWLSDTVLGAVIGIASAKLVDGHWRLFRIRPPRFLVSRGGAAVVAHASF